MKKLGATSAFVVMKLPEDRTLAPKNVVVGTYHELCFMTCVLLYFAMCIC